MGGWPSSLPEARLGDPSSLVLACTGASGDLGCSTAPQLKSDADVMLRKEGGLVEFPAHIHGCRQVIYCQPGVRIWLSAQFLTHCIWTTYSNVYCVDRTFQHPYWNKWTKKRSENKQLLPFNRVLSMCQGLP